MKANNPIIWADFPDPDVIRAGDTYYMVSTTMHMFPGGQILKSFDLIHWEHACYVFDALGDTLAQRLEGGHIYGKGMWAATLRHYNGLFHLMFTGNDAHKSYHFTAVHAQGPWLRHEIQGFYYDCSLLFDDDGRVYIAHGNKEIHITELNGDISGTKDGGLDRIALVDTGNVRVGFEGAHFYKINGKYYLFCIHWPNEGFGRRTEVCYMADSLTGEFTGGTIVDDDLGFHNMGVAQGGVIDTPGGQWYLMLFQDHGAVGRIPVLVPMAWDNGFPRVEKIPRHVRPAGPKPVRALKRLYASDTLKKLPLNPLWQWNHEPNNKLWSVSEKGLQITTGRIACNLEQAVNTLTQRTFGPACEAAVTVDASQLNAYDYAGLCALQGCFCQLAVTRDTDSTYISLISREAAPAPYAIAPPFEPVLERVHIKCDQPVVTLKASFRFEEMADTVIFYYLDQGIWHPVGKPHALSYRLDHFVGCRIGLFCYATKQPGGSAVFSDFQYTVTQEEPFQHPESTPAMG